MTSGNLSGFWALLILVSTFGNATDEFHTISGGIYGADIEHTEIRRCLDVPPSQSDCGCSREPGFTTYMFTLLARIPVVNDFGEVHYEERHDKRCFTVYIPPTHVSNERMPVVLHFRAGARDRIHALFMTSRDNQILTADRYGHIIVGMSIPNGNQWQSDLPRPDRKTWIFGKWPARGPDAFSYSTTRWDEPEPCLNEQSRDMQYVRTIHDFLQTHEDVTGVVDYSQIFSKGFSNNGVWAFYVGYCNREWIKGIMQIGAGLHVISAAELGKKRNRCGSDRCSYVPVVPLKPVTNCMIGYSDDSVKETFSLMRDAMIHLEHDVRYVRLDEGYHTRPKNVFDWMVGCLGMRDPCSEQCEIEFRTCVYTVTESQPPRERRNQLLPSTEIWTICADQKDTFAGCAARCAPTVPMLLQTEKVQQIYLHYDTFGRMDHVSDTVSFISGPVGQTRLLDILDDAEIGIQSLLDIWSTQPQSESPSLEPTACPTLVRLEEFSLSETETPLESTAQPSLEPSAQPSLDPTVEPSLALSAQPSLDPTVEPSEDHEDTNTMLQFQLRGHRGGETVEIIVDGNSNGHVYIYTLTQRWETFTFHMPSSREWKVRRRRGSSLVYFRTIYIDYVVYHQNFPRLRCLSENPRRECQQIFEGELVEYGDYAYRLQSLENCGGSTVFASKCATLKRPAEVSGDTVINGGMEFTIYCGTDVSSLHLKAEVLAANNNQNNYRIRLDGARKNWSVSPSPDFALHDIIYDDVSRGNHEITFANKDFGIVMRTLSIITDGCQFKSGY